MNQITKFNFNGIEIEAVTEADEWVLSDEQIGHALGYENPTRSIANLVNRNADELAGLATFTDLVKVEGDRQVTRQLRVWGERGVMAISFLARTNKATEFRAWARETLYVVRRGSSATKRDPITEVDRLANIAGQVVAQLGGAIQEISSKVEEQADRLAVVEERQRVTDPREIEKRMAVLHDLRDRIVTGTKDQMIPVTHPAYWRALKARFNVGSFQHRAALSVPLLDEVIEFARGWAVARGVPVQPLFAAMQPDPVGVE